MTAAITISEISKKYWRNQQLSRYLSLRDVITNSFKRSYPGNRKTEFFALNNINLQVNSGERLGIIGRNGAGKSTLLKIISRITPPTNGEIVIHGRVGSLLEVGTGFHPELTGRENIFLNGSILGLTKTEIKSKLDEIISFSGVEEFIDTPLKNYSSGMQLRLAFSVAAHLEPEILLIDEVLAVGDIEFQKKCLGKMEEVSKKDGRTILFVSHNLDAIHKFCDRSILLDKGSIVKDGKTSEVIEHYISNQGVSSSNISWSLQEAPGDDKLKLLNVFVHDSKGFIKNNYSIKEQIGITFQYEVRTGGLSFTHGVNIFNEQGLNIFDSHDNYSEVRRQERDKGVYKATVWIPSNLLPGGSFSVGVALFSQQPFYVYIHELHIVQFFVNDEISFETARGDFSGDYGGIIRPILKWEAEKVN